MTDPATLLTLAERCEQAAGPDRELDAEIAVALFGGEIIWKTANWTINSYPARRVKNSDYVGGYQNAAIFTYTESLDAAVTLYPVLPEVISSCPRKASAAALRAWASAHE
jgi:hypothetical protein